MRLTLGAIIGREESMERPIERGEGDGLYKKFGNALLVDVIESFQFGGEDQRTET